VIRERNYLPAESVCQEILPIYTQTKRLSAEELHMFVMLCYDLLIYGLKGSLRLHDIRFSRKLPQKDNE